MTNKIIRSKAGRITAMLFAFIFFGTLTFAAGGVLSGAITDPNGALIPGATLTLVPAEGGKPLTTVSDKQGAYRFDGLAPGTYLLTVTATGFAERKQEGIVITENGSMKIDLRLEAATVEAAIDVKASGLKGNSDPAYQQLRQGSKDNGAFSGAYATVNNLVLHRDAATFTLNSGELYFLSPSYGGRITAAVFIGVGEVQLTPPTDIEKKAIEIFTDSTEYSDQFNELVLHFTDKSFEEVKASSNARMGEAGPQAAKARQLYRDKEQLLRERLRSNIDLRTLSDLYAGDRPGYFAAFINGRRFSKILYMMDPQGVADVSPEEVALYSYGETDGGIWTAFHLADEYKNGQATSAEDRRSFDMLHHTIDCVIKGTHLTATDTITLKTLFKSERVLPFNLFPTLRVSRVQDEQGNDLNFIQEQKEQDADFAVILNQPVVKGTSIKLVVQYNGEGALRDSGGGNYILIPRSSWYPNNGGTQFGDRATFDMTFHYPQNFTFVGTGALVEAESEDKGMKVSKWSSGQTELAVAGFNYGDFKKKELLDKDTGYNIEFYANREVPDALKAMQMDIERAEAAGTVTGTTLGSISTSSMADSAIADAENATRIYTSYFGKLPFTRLAMSQQPAANFGQAWPTLVFMPFTAFMDSTQRTQMMGVRGGNDNFWRYVAPHEVAHQWWGHMVGWSSYHDQWMSEGFAEFSTSLYVQYVRHDMVKFLDFWENQRKLITEASPQTKGKKPYTVGPVTQGYRLNNGKTGNVARFMIYPKGAYILHMVRMMMYDSKTGDKQFREMMTDFIKTNYNRDISTEDFKRAVEKYMTPQMDLYGNKSMDWYFNEYVYGTEMPKYSFEYTLGSAGGKTVISGKITQSGVSDNFKMMVPIYLDFGKGWVKFASATITGNNTVELNNIPLPLTPKRASICALDDVLASSVENKKL